MRFSDLLTYLRQRLIATGIFGAKKGAQKM
jgi:hypothetical protein